MAFVTSIGNEYLFPPSPTHPTAATNPEYLKLVDTISREAVDQFLPVRCPDAGVSRRMEDLVAEYKKKDDSIGGTVTCVIRNCPSGLGEPCFDKYSIHGQVS